WTSIAMPKWLSPADSSLTIPKANHRRAATARKGDQARLYSVPYGKLPRLSSREEAHFKRNSLGFPVATHRKAGLELLNATELNLQPVQWPGQCFYSAPVANGKFIFPTSK